MIPRVDIFLVKVDNLHVFFLYFKMEFFIAFIFSMIYWQQESLERKALKAFIWIDKEKRLNFGQ